MRLPPSVLAGFVADLFAGTRQLDIDFAPFFPAHEGLGRHMAATLLYLRANVAGREPSPNGDFIDNKACDSAPA